MCDYSSTHTFHFYLCTCLQFTNDGVSWKDENWQTTQSTMNQPTVTMAEMLQQRTPNVKRSGSIKSLHQDVWNGNGNIGLNSNANMWNTSQAKGPTNRIPANDPRLSQMIMNPMMANSQAAFHRSMHELNMNMGGNPGVANGFFNPFQIPPTQRSTSPSNNSQKSNRSKKNSRSLSNKHSKTSKHRLSQDVTNSRPTSRNASRNSGRRSSGRKTSSRQSNQHSNRKRSTGKHNKRSDSSEEEENSENETETETDDDFFTGESDNDFVSLSSGSNPRKAPKKSWMCEHCTYVNNPGVSVCCV